MSDATSTPMLSQHQLRAELEAMVLGDLLGPAGGEGEELTERTVRDRSHSPGKHRKGRSNG